MRRQHAGVTFAALRAALALSVAVAGCATPRSALLERARTDYTAAAQDPSIIANAPVALHEAQAALNRADRALRSREDEKEIDHLAYLAQQRVEIARAQAQQKMAESQVQQLGEQREQVIISARTQEAERLRQELARLQGQQTGRGVVLTLGDVLFETGKAELRPGAFLTLDQLAGFLKAYPKRDVLIEGHTDNRGSDRSNLELSQRRAEAVRNYLLQNGITAERVIARGYGEAYPVAPNTHEAGRQQNRRVEIVVLNEGERATDKMRP